MFGDDREDDIQKAAEEGKVSTVTKPKEEAEMTGTEYYGKLALCVVGLQASYLTWGVLQVWAHWTPLDHTCMYNTV